MQRYFVLAVLLRFVVDLLLLLSANRLAGFLWGIKGCLLASLLGGIYGGVSLLPGFGFLQNVLWQGVILVLMGITAFGWQKSAVTRTAVFGLLRMALRGAAMGFGDGKAAAVLLSAAVLGGVCCLGFPEGMLSRQLVEVQLCHGGKRIALTALRDTGNSLTDPVTGQSVLIADAAAAWDLLGIGKAQLRDPIATLEIGKVKGLRLIPYRAIGQSSGLLLGIRVEQMCIGSWQGSGIVAFAPEGLGEDGTYRALTGGAI